MGRLNQGTLVLCNKSNGLERKHGILSYQLTQIMSRKQKTHFGYHADDDTQRCNRTGQRRQRSWVKLRTILVYRTQEWSRFYTQSTTSKSKSAGLGVAAESGYGYIRDRSIEPWSPHTYCCGKLLSTTSRKKLGWDARRQETRGYRKGIWKKQGNIKL